MGIWVRNVRYEVQSEAALFALLAFLKIQQAA